MCYVVFERVVMVCLCGVCVLECAMLFGAVLCVCLCVLSLQTRVCVVCDVLRDVVCVVVCVFVFVRAWV